LCQLTNFETIASFVVNDLDLRNESLKTRSAKNVFYGALVGERVRPASIPALPAFTNRSESSRGPKKSPSNFAQTAQGLVDDNA
jgi:hypothetical protein